MAQQTPPRQPVSNHYMTQAGLVVALQQLIAGLWAAVDPTRLKETLPPFEQQVYALVSRFSLVSAVLASRQYLAERAAAGVYSRFTPPLAPAPPEDQVMASLGWAVADLWKHPDQGQVALTNVDGAASRLVLNRGRETTLDAVLKDRQATGWAREARPNACSFCAMLATRGAVYKSARSAGEGHPYHNHCHCQVVPVFGVYEPTAQVRQWQADWSRVTAGLSGHAARLAWRHFIEDQQAANRVA
jgi:hypothetical protein